MKIRLLVRIHLQAIDGRELHFDIFIMNAVSTEIL